MQEISIQWTKTDPRKSLYTVSKPQFCWVAPPGKDGVWPQVTNFHGCRETFCGEYITYINSMVNKKQTSTTWTNSHSVKMDTKRLRICIAFNYNCSRTKKALEAQSKRINIYCLRGLQLIHILEKQLGWTRTRLLKVSNSGRVPVYVLSGSAKWLRSSQLVSLYLLMFRLGATDKFEKVKTFKGLLTTAKKLSGPPSGGQTGNDLNRIKLLVPYLNDILTNIDDLFFSCTQKASWEFTNSTYGINNLISGGGSNTTKQSFLALLKKRKAKAMKKARA